MRKLTLAAAVLLLFPLAAAAQLSIGASVGYAWPMGYGAKGAKLTEVVRSAVPVEATLAYAVTPELELGIYGGWAFGTLAAAEKADCALNGTSCSTHGYRVGLTGEYLLGSEGIVPFVGASAGWGWLTLVEKDAFAKMTFTLSGWELGLEGGAETKVSESLRLGAFVSLVFGEYGETRTEIESPYFNGSMTKSIASSDRRVHEWLTVGLRGRFGL